MRVVSNRIEIASSSTATNLEVNTVDHENYEVSESSLGLNRMTTKLTRAQVLRLRDILEADVTVQEIAYRLKVRYPDTKEVLSIIDDSLQT